MLFLLLIVLLFSESNAHASSESTTICECYLRNDSEKSWPEFRMDHYDAIFIGHVIKIEMLGEITHPWPLDRERVTTFEVVRSWKGPRSAEIKIIAFGSSVSCEYPFRAGQTYMVFAYLDETLPKSSHGQWRARICDFDGTGPLEYRKHHISVLDSLQAINDSNQ